MGINPGVGANSPEDVIAAGGSYPWQLLPQQLEVVSSSNQDAVGNTGAQIVRIQGLLDDFTQATELVEMNGTTPVLTQNQYLRINCTDVVATNTYAVTGTNDHAGTISTQIAGGGDVLSTIPIIDGKAYGKSQDAIYTVPKGHNLYVFGIWINTEVDKNATVRFFQRPNRSPIASPYIGARASFSVHRFQRWALRALETPVIVPEYTDVWAEAQYDENANGYVDVDAEVVLIKDIVTQ